MARRYDIRRVKIHRNYSISEIEKLLGVHKHTVARWVATGLPLIERRRPYLVHGTELREFLVARRPSKQPLQPGQFYCLRCRVPKRPAADFAEVQLRSTTTATLIGICPTCEGMMHRAVRLAEIGLASGDLEIAFQSPQPRLNESSEPLPNVVFK